MKKLTGIEAGLGWGRTDAGLGWGREEAGLGWG